MTPNYDAIRVAFATGNPVAARDEFFRLTLADRGVSLPETERKQ